LKAPQAHFVLEARLVNPQDLQSHWEGLAETAERAFVAAEAVFWAALLNLFILYTDHEDIV
jgi:hypothetical protein